MFEYWWKKSKSLCFVYSGLNLDSGCSIKYPIILTLSLGNILSLIDEQQISNFVKFIYTLKAISLHILQTLVSEWLIMGDFKSRFWQKVHK